MKFNHGKQKSQMNKCHSIRALNFMKGKIYKVNSTKLN